MSIPTTDLQVNFTAKAGTSVISNGLDAWTDQQNGEVASAVAATNRPAMDGTHLINGVDCPYFDGVDDYLATGAFVTASIPDGAVTTVAIVIKAPASGDSYNYICDNDGTFNRLAVLVQDTGTLNNIASRYGPNTNYAELGAYDTVKRVIVKFKDTGDALIYVDGVLASDPGVTNIANAISGLVLGVRGDKTFGFGNFTLAQLAVYTADVNVATLDNALASEWSTPSDTTAPTPGNSGAIAKANVTESSYDVTFAKATDDTSAQTALVYELYSSLSNNLDNVTNTKANGTLEDSGTDVTSLSAATKDPGKLYYSRVLVRDEAGNEALYNQISISTQFIYGNVDISGANAQGVTVWIYTVDQNLTNKTLVDTVTTDANGDYLMSIDYDATKHYLVEFGYLNVVNSGTVESANGKNITDTNNFPANGYDNGQYMFRTTGGTGAGQLRRITDTDLSGNVITLEVALSPQADATTTYDIVQFYSDEVSLIPRRG